jgi:hypothetical protein
VSAIHKNTCFNIFFPKVHAEKMREALTMDVLATDLADYLVRKGVRYCLSYPLVFQTHCICVRFLSVKLTTSRVGQWLWQNPENASSMS